MAPELREIYCHVDKQRIGLLRFFLEGYEGLACLSTVDRSTGLVRLAFPVERSAELSAVLEDFGVDRVEPLPLSGHLSVRLIPQNAREPGQL